MLSLSHQNITRNLMFEQGNDTPTDAEPSTLQRDGKHHVNTCLNVPRTSTEMDIFSEEYVKLTEAFEPIFNWVDQTVFSLILNL